MEKEKFKLPNPNGDNVLDILQITETELDQAYDEEPYGDIIFAASLLTYFERATKHSVVIAFLLEGLTGNKYNEMEDILEYLIFHIQDKKDRENIVEAFMIAT